ncbi:DUF547 domain-containing protein [Hymenobacter arizonensis]|uniref:DUF547 domain-containing protein n=1 Tax=Hymenobacter arizonensis TaxID=1227077 RepID=A0A1I5TKE8_HYMAR|nr:DUF547 domain-containing protein [Hymenobacter arizonensis]SFP83448.1 Protein of unknown function, DUF547 [Hymenobacter arizonensis]
MMVLNFSRRLITGLAVAAGLFLIPAAAATAAPPTLPAATSAFLAKFVDADGNVNYGAIKRNPLELQGLLKRVASYDAAAAQPDDRKAFYLNAYNLLVIGEVVARFPLESVEKVPGFFDKNLVSVAGEKLTLNDLEAKKLREPYNDPRVHFALVCGAKGCPKLNRAAYLPNSLDTQLTIQAQKVLQDPTFIRVDDKSRKVLISQIFKWYEADFKASGKTGVAYVNQFREGKTIPATYTVDYYPYDWSLNNRK